jgi:hypothetical protein
MDPAAVLLPLADQPAVITHQTAFIRGAWLPLAIPLAAVPASPRARWLLARPDLALDERVDAALAAGLDEEAWKLTIRAAVPVSGHLDLVLGAWAARELARLQAPAATGAVLVLADREQGRLSLDAATAMASARDTLLHLPWPRWSGPLVVMVGTPAIHDPAPGADQATRPALPVIRLHPVAGSTPGEALAARICQLALDLTAPPPAGWPPWLRIGLAEVARAKVRGEGPSPLRMLEIRQQAGVDLLRRLLSDRVPDAQLAMAVCAPLVHTRRRHLLPNLLDLLRGAGDSEGALRIAYGLTPEILAQER